MTVAMELATAPQQCTARPKCVVVEPTTVETTLHGDTRHLLQRGWSVRRARALVGFLSLRHPRQDPPRSTTTQRWRTSSRNQWRKRRKEEKAKERLSEELSAAVHRADRQSSSLTDRGSTRGYIPDFLPAQGGVVTVPQILEQIMEVNVTFPVQYEVVIQEFPVVQVVEQTFRQYLESINEIPQERVPHRTVEQIGRRVSCSCARPKCVGTELRQHCVAEHGELLTPGVVTPVQNQGDFFHPLAQN